MKEPFYTYEEFPENLSQEEGMKIIYGKDEIGITCRPDVDASRRYPTVSTSRARPGSSRT